MKYILYININLIYHLNLLCAFVDYYFALSYIPIFWVIINIPNIAQLAEHLTVEVT